MVYLNDIGIYIADIPSAGLAAWPDHRRSPHLRPYRASQEIDQKRFANAAQTLRHLGSMGPGARNIELGGDVGRRPPTPVGIGFESDHWMSYEAVNRYIRTLFIATSEAQSGIFYSFAFEMPMRYYTRTEDEEGGNTVVTLMGRAFYDPDDFGGIFRPIVVNTLTEAELG